MASKDFYSGGKIPGQVQIRRDESTAQGQATNSIQETGTQVKNMAKGAAQSAANVAANMAQSTAEAVKNTLGINHPSNTTTGTTSPKNITKGGSRI